MALRLRILVGAGSPWAPAAIRAMAAAGAEPQVICIENPGGSVYSAPEAMRVAWASVAASVTSFESLRLRTQGVRSALEIASHLRQRNPVDHTLCLYGGLFALAARLSRSGPYSIYLVGSDVLRLGRLQMPVATWAYRGAAHLVANGDALAEAASQLTGQRVESLLLGIDTEQFTPGSSLEGPYRWVCARGFLPVYQNDRIIEALGLLPQDGSWRMTFLAGGEGLESCRAKAPAKVEFLGGVPPHTMAQHLQTADGFVSFSLSDGTSTAVLEALSCGLPGVLSDILANRPLAARFSATLATAPVDDIHALAEGMRRTMERGRPTLEAKSIQHRAVAEFADSRKTMARLIQILGG